MQKRRDSSEEMFGSMNSLGGFGDIGRFGSHRSMLSNLFGGRDPFGERDPFDDPFFTRPFDSMFGPTSSSAQRNMRNMNKDKGIVIKELDSDDEGDINCSGNGDEEKKYSRSTMEPSVEHPDDDDDVHERKLKQVTHMNDHYKAEPPKTSKVSFQTSKVTYGGVDGAYYTSTRTRRTGTDGVVMEEGKEADTTTGQATHRISRGIHDQGHSFTRRLNSDGKIDTMQTLHNLNEDELSGFEEKWKGNNIGHLPGWKDRHGTHRNKSSGNNVEPGEKRIWKNRSFPSLEQRGSSRGFGSGNETSSGGRTKKVVRINIE